MEGIYKNIQRGEKKFVPIRQHREVEKSNKDRSNLSFASNRETEIIEVEEGFTYTVRKIVNTKMEPYIFLTPFEVVDLIFTMTVRKLNIKCDNGKSVDVKFNLMDKHYDIENYYNKIAFTEEGSFGNYDLAERRIWAEYTDSLTPKSLIQLNKNIYNCRAFDDDLEET